MRSSSFFFCIFISVSLIMSLFFNLIIAYIYLIVLFFLCCALWIWFYQKCGVSKIKRIRPLPYALESIALFFLGVVLTVGGIRGDFKKSTRPIAPIHAMEYVDSPQQGDIVLNTPFNVIRTFGKMTLYVQKTFPEEVVFAENRPIKHYATGVLDPQKPNVVLIILESMGREYWGALNENYGIPNYESFTPFLDSLAQHAFGFPTFLPIAESPFTACLLFLLEYHLLKRLIPQPPMLRKK